ncbi:ATP-dependent Clp protease proteolytic subunit [Pseudoxanthomonas sp. LjRoot125]|uniref:ATP-dependent Clp protease proteolytic subunit n=1 Tax=Pseudoxanthomonas sp. LjRoot125 TaxID=3342258 RepID=UPI003E115144
MKKYISFACLVVLASVPPELVGAEVESNEVRLFSDAAKAVHECSVLEKGVAYASKAEALCVKGPATYQLQKDFDSRAENLSSAAMKVKLVVVDSDGGEMRPAIAIAHLIERMGADVIVGRMCASSCAQFIFMAGRRKYVMEGGHVLFHGGPLSAAKIASLRLPHVVGESLMRQNKEFLDFYTERSISIDMLTKPPEEVQERISAGEVVMWEWPRERLEEFGVGGLMYERDFMRKVE